jgi:hypothetical protein
MPKIAVAVPKRTGNIIVLWSQPPETVAAAALDSCID